MLVGTFLHKEHPKIFLLSCLLGNLHVTLYLTLVWEGRSMQRRCQKIKGSIPAVGTGLDFINTTKASYIQEPNRRFTQILAQLKEWMSCHTQAFHNGNKELTKQSSFDVIGNLRFLAWGWIIILVRSDEGLEMVRSNDNGDWCYSFKCLQKYDTLVLWVDDSFDPSPGHYSADPIHNDLIGLHGMHQKEWRLLVEWWDWLVTWH